MSQTGSVLWEAICSIDPWIEFLEPGGGFGAVYLAQVTRSAVVQRRIKI